MTTETITKAEEAMEMAITRAQLAVIAIGDTLDGDQSEETDEAIGEARAATFELRTLWDAYRAAKD